MGCDIHIVAERFRDGKWQLVGEPTRPYADDPDCLRMPEPYDGRNYELFSILAGVRNRFDFDPIVEPRGIPKDASPAVKKWIDSWDGDGHSHSYLTVAEILDYDWDRGMAEMSGVIPVFRDEKVFHAEGGENSFEALKGTGKAPTSYSQGISGPGIVNVDGEREAMALLAGTQSRKEGERYYVRYHWNETYRDAAGKQWFECVQRLQEIDQPDLVRIVFFFDN